MISDTTAKQIAEEWLKSGKQPKDFNYVILDSQTFDRETVWVFYYQSSKYLETKKFDDMLIGNGAILVDKMTGKISVAGTARPLEYYIANYEKYGTCYPMLDNERIDNIEYDRATSTLKLHLYDGIQWSSDHTLMREHIKLLEKKLNIYCNYIDSGEAFRDYGRKKTNRVEILIHGMGPMNQDSKRFLDGYLSKISGKQYKIIPIQTKGS